MKKFSTEEYLKSWLKELDNKDLCSHDLDYKYDKERQALSVAIKAIEELKEVKKTCLYNHIDRDISVWQNKRIEKLEQELSRIKGIKINDLIIEADKALGYEGIGTKMTSEEIDKVFTAIHNLYKEKQ